MRNSFYCTVAFAALFATEHVGVDAIAIQEEYPSEEFFLAQLDSQLAALSDEELAQLDERLSQIEASSTSSSDTNSSSSNDSSADTQSSDSSGDGASSGTSESTDSSRAKSKSSKSSDSKSSDSKSSNSSKSNKKAQVDAYNEIDLAQINAEIAAELGDFEDDYQLAQVGAKSEGALDFGLDDDLALDLAQINAEIEDEYDVDEFAEIEGGSNTDTSSESSSSSASDANSQDSNDLAQINDFAQTGAMTEAEIEAEIKDNREFFTTFLAQMGINEGEQFLAQLGEHLTDD